MNYGGRFTESAESFRAGLALMDKFAQWYANLAAGIRGENFDTPTKVNADKGAVPVDGVKGYEMFVFQDLAIRPDVDLDEQEPENLFGIGHNDAVNFFARGNGMSCVGTLAKLSPAKRQVVYAAFKAIEPPLEANPNRASTNVRNNVGYLARILRHFDEVVALQAEGKLDRAHLNQILTPDLDLPPDATSGQVRDAIQVRILAKYAKSPAKIGEVGALMGYTGCTVTEALAAVETGKKPANLPDIASTTMRIEDINGTTSGGRAMMLGDLCRPSNPSYVGGRQLILSDDENHFVVKIGGETIQCILSGNPDVNAPIADKIENLCGKVHVEQANTVMRGLAQGAHTPILATLPQYGVNVSEHMALTYTLSKNDDTGAVTIRYSEPKGFPLKFSWETTVALDGTSTTTPIAVDAPKDFPGYRKLAGVEGGGLFTSNTVAPGKGPAATAFRNMIETRCGAPANASPIEKAKAFAGKVNERGAKEMAFKLALVASKNLVEKNGDVKKMDVDSVNFQFNRDLIGGYKFFYPGVEGASQDYYTNRDNLVRFVTDDNTATFATATEATKRKVGILMAVLTQYTSTMVTETVDGVLTLPDSASGFFASGVFGAEKSSTEFHLSKDADGNIKITTKDRQSVSMLQTFGENDEPLSMNPVKQGSYYEYEMEITLPKDNLETLANADWAQYDRETVNNYNGDIDGRIALIPEEFRFNGTVNISYHMHLNEE